MGQTKKKTKLLKEITNTPRDRKPLDDGDALETERIKDTFTEPEKCYVVPDEEILDLNIIEDSNFFTEEDFQLMQSEDIFPDLNLDENDMIFINK